MQRVLNRQCQKQFYETKKAMEEKKRNDELEMRSIESKALREIGLYPAV